MAYQLRVLDAIADTEPARLIGEVGAAIAAGGSWERFAEVRTSAAPTVRITPDGTGYLASVSWGS